MPIPAYSQQRKKEVREGGWHENSLSIANGIAAPNMVSHALLILDAGVTSRSRS